MTNFCPANFSIYITRVYKNILHRDNSMLKIKKDAIMYVNSLLMLMLKYISDSSDRYKEKITKMFTGEVRENACREGDLCIQKLFLYGGIQGVKLIDLLNLNFPPTKVARTINITQIITEQTLIVDDVFLTGVVEYICAEMLDMGKQKCISEHSHMITVDHIKTTVENDDEFVFYKQFDLSPSSVTDELYRTSEYVRENTYSLDNVKCNCEVCVKY